MSGTKIIVNPPASARVIVTQNPPTSIKVNTPQIFRVLGASDVAVLNPADGQVLTWNTASSLFNLKILPTVASANLAQAAFDEANSANILAQAAFDHANTGTSIGNVNNAITFTTGLGLTVNNKTSITIVANNTILLAANGASVTAPGVVQLSDILTSTSTSLAATANVANALNTQLTAEHTFAQGAYNLANSDANLAASAFNEANGFQSIINSVFALANSTTNLVTGAYTEANSALNLSQSAFGEANGFQSVINTTFGLVNSHSNLIVGAYANANAALAEANAFQAIVNSVYILANSTSNLIIGAYANANAALAQANAFQSIINSAFSLANSDANLVTGAYSEANSALNLAQSAYARANVNITGQLTFVANTGLTVNNNTSINFTPNATIVFGANQSTINQLGIVQLTDSVLSISTTTAATPNSVNTVWATAQAAFFIANSDQNLITSVYPIVNSHSNLIVGAYANANAAFAEANAFQSIINSAFTVANSALNLSQSAFTEANAFQSIVNSAYTLINSHSNLIVGAYSNANASFAEANAFQSIINSSFTLANSTSNLVTGAYSNANAAFAEANAFQSIINSSFTIANSALNLAQGAYTKANNAGSGGALTVTYIANPGLTVNTAQTITLSGNGTVVFAANTATITQLGITILNDIVTSNFANQAATANAVNTVWATAQAVFTLANSTSNLVTGAYSNANAAFAEANAFQSIINSVFTLANSTTNLVKGSYANANAAFAEANAFQSIINSAFSLANTAVQRAGDTMTGSLTINPGQINVLGNATIDALFTYVNSNTGDNGWFGIPAWNQHSFFLYVPNGAGGNEAGLNYDGTNHQWNFNTNNITRFVIDKNGNVSALVALAINGVDIGSGLASNWTLTNSTSNLITGAYANANAAFAEANAFQSIINSAFGLANSDANLVTSAYSRANVSPSLGSIIVTATSGVAVGGGSTSTLIANGTFALTANSATTGAVGVVQLTDVVTSTSTTTAATANAVNTVWATAQAAFAKANTGTSGSGGGIGSINVAAINGLTVGGGSFATITANGTFSLSTNNATTGAVGVVSLTDSILSISTTTAATPNSVNTVWSTAQASFTLANSTTNLVTGAYAEANSALNLSQSAFLEANAFQSIINSSFTLANSTSNLVAGAYANANGAFAEANAFQSIINSSFTLANSTTNLVTGAYNIANSALNLAQSAFGEANGFQSIINSAFSLANSDQNLIASVFAEANGFQSIINSAFTLANSTSNLITGAYANANGAFAEANAFQSIINSAFLLTNSTTNLVTSAYARANISPSLGSIIVTATSGVAVGGGSTSTLTANGTFALTANSATTGVLGVVQLTDSILSISTTTAATPNSVNTVWSTAQAAFFIATSDQNLVASVFTLANSHTNLIASVFAEANGFQSIINSSFTLANSTTNLVTGAYSNANAAFAEANAFQSIINSVFSLANSTTNLVTGAYALANSDQNLIASVFAEANGFQSIINSSFTLANSTTNLVTGAYALANSHTNLIASVFAEANGFQSIINSAFTQANVGVVYPFSGTVTVNSLTSNVGINTGFMVANSNITALNFNSAGVVNTQSIMVKTINVGGTYVLSTNDSGSVIYFNNSNAVTVNTSQLNTAPGGGGSGYIGFRTVLTQLNTGMVTVQQGPSTFLQPRITGNTAIFGQNASVSLVCYAANSFLMDGALSGTTLPTSQIIDNLTSILPNEALSANMGNYLATTFANGYFTAKVTTNIGAIGTTQGTITTNTQLNIITVCGAAQNAVTLHIPPIGAPVTVMNYGATNAKLFPPSGHGIGTLALNANTTIFSKGATTVFLANSNHWYITNQDAFSST